MTLSDAVGTRAERIFQESFPDFAKVKLNGSVPDFTNGDFWVEVKTSFWSFGARLHDY